MDLGAQDDEQDKMRQADAQEKRKTDDAALYAVALHRRLQRVHMRAR